MGSRGRLFQDVDSKCAPVAGLCGGGLVVVEVLREGARVADLRVRCED